MRLVGLLVLAMSLIGCGTSDSDEPATEPAPSASAKLLTMLDICPMVEDALPARGFEAGVAGFQAFADDLASIHGEADPEAQNAIEAAQSGTDRLVKVLDSGKTGLFASEGEEAFLAGMETLTRRCAAAGSSALQ